MTEIEEFIKPKKKNKQNKNDDIYDYCDKMLEAFSHLDAELEKREKKDSFLLQPPESH